MDGNRLRVLDLIFPFPDPLPPQTLDLPGYPDEVYVRSCLPAHPVDTGAITFGEAYHGDDRISALPNELLRMIVSKLPLKDGARTTMLSKRWVHLWPSTPLVCYDNLLTGTGGTESSRAATVNTILSRHRSFSSVHVSTINFSQSNLCSWAPLLVGGRVEDLVLVALRKNPTPRLPTVPTDIFQCSKLQRLYLGHFCFPSELHDGFIFPCVEELAILNCSITQSSLDSIIKSAPMLKKFGLVLISSEDVIPLNVNLGGPHLQMINIVCFLGSEINVKAAPCLEKILAWKLLPPETKDMRIHSKKYLDAVKPFGPGRGIVKITIDYDSSPKVVGYLDAAANLLRIGTTFVKFTTDVRSIVVPSVKVLALKVDLGRVSQARVMASWL